MADLSIVAASVVKGSDASQQTGTAGETITAGQALYLKSADNRWWKAQIDGTAEEAGSGGIGIALHGSLAGQPITVQTGGSITIGATVVAGTEYVVSRTFGGIAPHADLASTDKYTRLGYASSATVLVLVPLATGIAVP